MKVHFERDFLRNSYKVFLITESVGGRQAFMRADDTVVTPDEGAKLNDDEILFCRLPYDAMQAFANELAAVGIKTDNDHKIAGVLEATKYHLEDMRTIAKVAKHE